MISYADNDHFYYSNRLKLIHGFTDAKAGSNGNWKTRRQFFRVLSSFRYDQTQFATPLQVHRNRVQVINLLTLRHTLVSDCDGLLYQSNSSQRVCLYIKTADCLPIIVYNQPEQVIGVVHMGWQGALQGIIDQLVSQLGQLHCQLEATDFIFGPSIGACCYNISMDREELFKKQYGQADPYLQHGRFNLLGFALWRLRQLGVLPLRLEWRLFCTSCQNNRFYSYRQNPGERRRLLAFITLNA